MVKLSYSIKDRINNDNLVRR